jgi:hypothetical protein
MIAAGDKSDHDRALEVGVHAKVFDARAAGYETWMAQTKEVVGD